MYFGYVHIEFWGEKTAAQLFAIICEIATTLQIRIVATQNVGNDEGGSESSFDFAIANDIEVDRFHCFCNCIRDRGIRVKEAALGAPDDENWREIYNEDDALATAAAQICGGG